MTDIQRYTEVSGVELRERVPPINDGRQIVARFENGYGASVVQHSFSYGGPQGLWELAVVAFEQHPDDWVVGSDDIWDFTITYSTPITSDVIGWLDESEVVALCTRIAELAPAEPPALTEGT